MSLKSGNNYLKNGQYALALQEYKKIPKDSPLYEQALFNIERIKKLGLVVEKKSTTDIASPLLSIVMPVFNVGPYLDASILSVLSQTLTDFELIIINDASTDNGKRIIEMYKNIVYISIHWVGLASLVILELMPQKENTLVLWTVTTGLLMMPSKLWFQQQKNLMLN